MKLIEYRTKKKLVLKEMADLIGVKSPTTIFNYENGRVPPKPIMEKIEIVTKGWVKAKDFYSYEKLQEADDE